MCSLDYYLLLFCCRWLVLLLNKDVIWKKLWQWHSRWLTTLVGMCNNAMNIIYSYLAVCNAKVRNSPIGMQEGKTPAFYVMFNHSAFPGHIQKSKMLLFLEMRLQQTYIVAHVTIIKHYYYYYYYSTAVTDSINRIAQVAKFSLFQLKTQLN